MSDRFEPFLEALGLSAELPSPRFFEELFLRFSLRFPYESLTRREPGRDPDSVLRGFVEDGTGSVGFERARAFLALARDLGFDVRVVRGERRGPESRPEARLPHGGILARLEGREFLLDPALPIPILLPLEPAGTELPSPAGGISLVRVGERVALAVTARGRTRARAWFELAVAPANLLEELQKTEDEVPDPLEAQRFFDDRLLRFRGGRIEVLDRWSRLEYGVAGNVAELLEALFVISPEALSEGPPEVTPLDGQTGPGAGVLCVYDASELPVATLQARLTSPESLLLLNPAGTCFDELERSGNGWTWRLTDEAEVTLRRERVHRTENGVEIETLEGESPIARRSLSLRAEGTGTRVTMRAALSRPVPPRGLAESVRKTLVFHLASELLALSRDVETETKTVG